MEIAQKCIKEREKVEEVEEKEGGREGRGVRGVVVIGGRLERRQNAIEEIHSP